MTAAPLVLVRDLVKHYMDGPRVVRVLEGLSFEIATGELVAVVGESGVGKSTLLHLLGTLDHPSAGEIELGGQKVTQLSQVELARLRNREIGFVFQFHHLLSDFTALENVMMPALIGGAPRQAARRRAVELLERVGLSERLHHRPGELSGGEQQRVAVARALVQGPRLVLADEPTGNLDPGTAEGVHRLLLELNAERHITMVIATHNRQLAALAHRTFELAGGKIFEHKRGNRRSSSAPSVG